MTTLLVACGALARELIALQDKHAWDVKILALPALLHNTPHLIPDAIEKRVKAEGLNFTRTIIVYGDCGSGGMLDRKLDELGLERISGPHCYEQYAGAEEFSALMDNEPGTYFLTDYLVQSFDHLVIEGMGLDKYPELRDEYFRNYRRVVYLQQRQDKALLEKARAAAETLKLPLEVRFTGYGALEARLSDMLSGSE